MIITYVIGSNGTCWTGGSWIGSITAHWSWIGRILLHLKLRRFGERVCCQCHKKGDVANSMYIWILDPDFPRIWDRPCVKCVSINTACTPSLTELIGLDAAVA